MIECAVDIKAIGIPESARVTVCRPRQDKQRLTPDDELAGERLTLDCYQGAHLHWALIAQGLLDSPG
jgi:hypothetical protein